MRKLILLPVRFYQLFISPVMPSHCRHYPTCSYYTIEAVQRHGVLRGVWLGAKRLLRCHPFSKGGFDPVPEVEATRSLRVLREK